MDSAKRHINVVVQKNLHYYPNSFILSFLAMLYTAVGILPMFAIDVYTVIFQYVYFGIHHIPKLDRREYVVMDRHRLRGLSPTQKVNCVYCGYANGVAGFAKAVVEQMERFSCAVKHEHEPLDQKQQKNFYERSKFS